MSLLLQITRPYRTSLLFAALLSIFAAALELLPHVIVYLAAADVFSTPTRTDRLWSLAFLALGGVVLRYLFLGGGVLTAHAVAFRALRGLRIQMVDILSQTTTAAREAHSPGDLKKAIVEDVDAVEAMIAHNIGDLASAIVVPTLAFLALLSIDWRMALVSVSLVPVGILMMSVIMRGSTEQYALWHNTEANANDAILEYLRGIVTLKAHDRDASSLSRVRSAVHGIRDLAAVMTRRTGHGYAAFFTVLSSNLVVVLPFGLWLHQRGELDAPTFVLFLLLGFGLTTPLLKLLFLFGAMQTNSVRLERIQTVLSLPVPTANLTTEPPPNAGLFMDAVHFSYTDERGPVLTDITLHAPQGAVTAIVGPSGSGKSTLMALLAGLRAPTSGTIRTGAVDIATCSPQQRASLMALIRQKGWLFHGSLRDNIRVARPNASDADIQRVVQLALLEDVITGLPNGLDSLVGERGATLSGGEVQRVAIARVLLLNTPILLLDEVTAHLDAQSERAVQRALMSLIGGRTVVVIAHRLRTIRHADHIVVLDTGRVVGSGQHEHLIQTCPTYTRLWNAQENARTWRVHSQQPTLEVTL